jgi:hypothetical protein
MTEEERKKAIIEYKRKRYLMRGLEALGFTEENIDIDSL